ncbi:MAG TPA: hypothetical protein VMG14_01025 [Thermoplasmata archaeon]|nr:hypothetical protein [Thermoplasmata archaeon]HTW76336.1 hypothetical protein [Thermoplasmata archaeon]
MPQEPTNGELAVMITGLRDELQEDHEEHTQFHAKIEGKLEAVTTLLATLQQRVAVERAQADAKHGELEHEIDAHEKWHERQTQSEERRKSLNSNVALVIVGALGVGATLLGVLVH